MKNVDCKPGVFVVDGGGRVGLISGRTGIIVQYGAGGPHEYWDCSELRPATAEEVRLAGLEGVGGRII